ncbi:MAG: ATP-binding cassette domain-containing protein [Deltaproteobacteria bacterium]|nr:MAG: ATP-binding cassette domain-containing protein [Deltaproteobacteria bacterium]TMA74137.1 MAG: ATP-binding cassette domain-containing protein [Deltaproteobacteria bacterium]TMB33643.1 MAG: ATP-binding cassette domain-containing protein [Deltaproteobacteria bacterium]
MTALLEVRGLKKSFDDFTAVAGVDLALPEGGITAVIGPNGAGKTTFINLLTGKLTPSHGNIVFAGKDVTRLPASARVRGGMARTFQITNVFPLLSVEENVSVPVLARAGRSLDPRHRLDAVSGLQSTIQRLLDTVGLTARRGDPAGLLSHGDRRLLEIALALASEPRLLLLDEPTAGMGTGERDRVLAQIRALAMQKSLTILLVEHDMEVVFGLATRIVVLHQGRVLADGTPQQIRDDPHVREIYLGEANIAPVQAAPAGQGAPLLQVEHLDAGYGLAHVLHDVSFTVARGEIVALLGRNGVGKTTTLRSLAGLNVPWRGSIVRLEAKSVAGDPPERLAALGVSYVPDDRRIFADLTAAENLRVPVLALRRGKTRWTRERIEAIFPPLATLWNRKGRHLSGGEQKMLAIARALTTDPALLLLDEPSEGLSPLIVRILSDALAQIRGEGVTVLLADQNLMFARAVADRALVMERGRLVHAASRAELQGNDPALHRFLAV